MKTVLLTVVNSWQKKNPDQQYRKDPAKTLAKTQNRNKPLITGDYQEGLKSGEGISRRAWPQYLVELQYIEGRFYGKPRLPSRILGLFQNKADIMRRDEKTKKPTDRGDKQVTSRAKKIPLPKSTPPFPIVGVGASAGGLEALESFLGLVPLIG